MQDMERPLSDVMVLELGHIVAGPYCSLLLADLGAEVIKVEGPEGGDVLRESSPGASGIFNYMNRNKQSITLDLKDENGIEVFEDLVAEADVLIENYSPGTVDGLGVGYENMREVNPELIYCSVKGFNEGPYEDRPALDPVAEALSGLMTTTGYPEQPPTRAGTSIADMAASFHGTIAILGALRQRDAGEGGQHITAPMFEATAGLMGGHIAFSDAYDEPAKPMKGGSQQLWAPYGVFKTGDEEWVFVGPSSEAHWKSLCNVMGFDDLLADERFGTLPERRENQDQLDELLGDAFAEFTQQEIVDRLERGDVPVAPVQDSLEVADDPHLKETGSLVEVNASEGKEGPVRVPGSPIRSTGFERPPAEDPPALGEDTKAYLRQFGYTEERIDELHEQGVI